MVPTRPRVPIIALAVVASLAACQAASPGASAPPSVNTSLGPSSAPSASASAPGAAPEPLVQLLDFLTLDTTNVFFTDWDGLKAAYGTPDLTSADPLEERLAFLNAMMGPSATDAPYACFYCRGYRADALKTNWGFDNADSGCGSQYEPC